MQKKRAFTLIELVVVMALIAILATLVVAAILAARNAANDTTRRSNAHSIQVALEAYYAANKEYPDTASECLTNPATTTCILQILSANYISQDITDPDPTATGNARYCYARSRQGYVFGVWMGATSTATGAECNPSEAPYTAPGTVTGANTEDFSLNP